MSSAVGPRAVTPPTTATTPPRPIAVDVAPQRRESPAPPARRMAAPAVPSAAVVSLGGIGVVLVLLQSSAGFPVELLGVDVLLTVAGFRVAYELLAGGAGGRVPLVSWWHSRIARYVPLLVVVVAATTGLAVLLGGGTEAGRVGLDAVAALAGASNWWELARRVGWAPGITQLIGLSTPPVPTIPPAATAVDPLGAFWLVAVLIQLAVAGSLLLTLLRWVLRATTARRALLLAPVLFAAAYGGWLAGAANARFGLAETALGTHARAAEWLLGAAAAAAVVGLRPDRRRPAWLGSLVAAVGLAVVVAAAVAAALAPAQWLRWGGPCAAAGGVALVLLAVHLSGDGPLPRALGRGFPVELGRSAYGLLVLHLPVWWLIQQAVPDARPAALIFVGGALTWLLALVVRDGVLGRLHNRRPLVTAVGLLLVAAATVMGAIPLAVRAVPVPGTLAPNQVMAVGGVLAADAAEALERHSSRYAVTETGVFACGLLPGHVATHRPRTTDRAQEPLDDTPPCDNATEQWRAAITDLAPVAVVVDLSADADATRLSPCTPGFRNGYRDLIAAAVPVWTGGDPERPVLVTSTPPNVETVGDASALRCLDALVAEAVATHRELVPLDVDALLCPDGTCPLRTASGEPLFAGNGERLSAAGLAELAPWLEQALDQARAAAGPPDAAESAEAGPR